MWILKDEDVQELATDVLLCDLTKLHGKHALLSKIEENIGGVYVWYRRFQFDEETLKDPAKFVEYILGEVYKQHSAVREARLAPAHRLRLSADTVFSKKEHLETYANNPSFRLFLSNLLENSLIFQQPLYIGKTNDFHARIGKHLSGSSSLRRRLKEAGHDIDSCRLLLLYMRDDPTVAEGETDDEDDPTAEGLQPMTQSLVEDIISRLFLPTFTVRYG